MTIGNTLLQLIVAGGLINVWVFRKSKNTSFRGAHSATLKQEFKAYGLPVGVYYLVGFLKISAALVLLISFWIPQLQFYSASVIALLMLGAVAMHIKVQDPLLRSLPAAAMLVMSLSLVYLSF